MDTLTQQATAKEAIADFIAFYVLRNADQNLSMSDYNTLKELAWEAAYEEWEWLRSAMSEFHKADKQQPLSGMAHVGANIQMAVARAINALNIKPQAEAPNNAEAEPEIVDYVIRPQTNTSELALLYEQWASQNGVMPPDDAIAVFARTKKTYVYTARHMCRRKGYDFEKNPDDTWSVVSRPLSEKEREKIQQDIERAEALLTELRKKLE